MPPTNQNPSVESSSRGLLLMLASVVFFSASVLVIKAIHVQYGLSFWVITLPRFVVGLLLVRILYRGSQSVEWKSLVLDPWMVARGVVGGIGVPLYNLCVIEIGPGRTTVINASYPIFGMLLAPLFLPEPLRWRAFGYGALAIAGVVAMTGPEALAAGPNRYDLLAVAIAFSSGFVVVLIRKLHVTSNTATIFASQCAYGLVFCAPGFFLDLPSISLAPIGLILLGAGLVAAGQLLMTQSFRSVSVARGSTIQLLGPPFVVVASFLLFGETLSPLDILGGAVILAACYRIARAPAS